VLSDSMSVGSRISSQSLIINVKLHSVYINSGDYDCCRSMDDEAMELSQTVYGV